MKSSHWSRALATGLGGCFPPFSSSSSSLSSSPPSFEPSLSPRADRLHVRRQRRLSRVQIRKEQLCMCPDAAMAQINEIGLDDDDEEEAEDDGAGGAAPPPVADV